MKPFWTTSIALAGALLVGACSIDETPSLALQSGVFLDSPVEGLALSGGQFTQTGGVYRYNPDSTIQFSVGSIEIGELFLPRTLFQGRLVTPVDLFPNATSNSLPVINVVRFLLTIDFDQDPDNGIQIVPELHEAAVELDIDFEGNFDVDVMAALDAFAGPLGGVRTPVDLVTAQGHLQANLISARAGGFSGVYTVEQNGEAVPVGTLDLVFTRSGEICGFLREEGGSPEAITGTVPPDTTSNITFTVPTLGLGFGGDVQEDVFGGGWGGAGAGPGDFEVELIEIPQFFLGLERLEFVGGYVGRIGQGEEIEVLVEPNGDISLAEPEVCGTILSIAGGQARFFAVSVVGDILEGTIENGRMRGTSTSSEGSVAFTLDRP